MYAGTTFRRDSGRIVGVHQKIDRASRRLLKKLIGKDAAFPSISQILHFEGINGPDGIKRKSPSKDEPWHYIDPTKDDDRALIGLINDHMANLVVALRTKNDERAAFEAAWLAHAIVDGLTPAHHYPVLYLFHGTSGRASDWVNSGGAAATTDGLPVITVTARAMQGDREKSIDAGATDYITKPIDIEELLNCMERWLSPARSAR